MIVIDPSALAPLALKDEDQTKIAALLQGIRDHGALVPALWWFEIRNLMLMAERRSRITAEQSADFLKHVEVLGIAQDAEADEQAVFSLARSHDLTFYDAAYLELALRTRSSLATEDRKLIEAARKASVNIFP